VRILLLPSWYPDKHHPYSGIFIQEQAKLLTEYGHEVVVAFQKMVSLKDAWGRGSRSGSLGLKFRKQNGLPVYSWSGINYFPKLKFLQKKLYISRYLRMYRLIKADYGEPDIIHCHVAYYAGVGAVGLHRKYHIPLVVTEHSSAHITGKIPREKKAVVKKVYRDADKLVVVSPFLKKHILAAYAVPEKQIAVVPNMVDTTFFQPESQLSETMDKENLKKKRPVFRFFSLAALVENKGFDQLIRAFASLEKIDVELCIGGDGPQRGALEKLCKDLGVCDRVQFLGLLERREVLEQMNLCDAFVLASHYETFGIVYIEALSCGKPVLATSCGGPESIVHQQNGMLVPVGDTHELVKALERMVETIDNYDKQSIRDDCINRFGKQVIAERLSQLYQDMLPSYN